MKNDLYKYTLTFLLLIVITYIDLNVEHGIAGGVPYISVIFMTLWLPGKKPLVLSVFISVLLVILGYFQSPLEATDWKVLFNRSIALFAISITGTVCWMWKRSDEKLKSHIKTQSESLKKAEAIHLGIIEAAVDAIITINKHGIIQSCNHAAEILFKYRSDEIIGQNIKILMPHSFAIEHDQFLSNYLSSGIKKIIGKGREVTGQRKDGSQFPMYLSVGEMTIKGESFFTGIVHDITDRVEAENELKQSNAELEKFAYISSHDLKSPLRAIENLAKWIHEDAFEQLPERSKSDLSQLRNRVSRMNQLIEDLLQYSRIGHKKYQLEQIHTASFIEDITHTINVPASFKINIVKPMPDMKTLAPPLKQIILNLIVNAIKHHHDQSNGIVNVQCIEKKDFYSFTITDNGPGIDKEFHQSIFNMFQTLQPRDDVEGSGMGLAFIDKTIRHYGGSISVDSATGHGATFTFTWPIDIKGEKVNESF